MKIRGVRKYSRPTLVMDMDRDWVQLSTSDWLTVIIIIMLIIIIVIFVNFNINMTNKPESNSTRAPGRHSWLRQELFMLSHATTDLGLLSFNHLMPVSQQLLWIATASSYVWWKQTNVTIDSTKQMFSKNREMRAQVNTITCGLSMTDTDGQTDNGILELGLW